MKISTLFASALMLAVPGMAGAETVAVTATPAQAVARGLASSGARRTVLAQTRVAPDTYRRLVKDDYGRVFYDIVRQGRVSAAPQRITVPMRAPQNASFFEDFESHAGQLDWLPEGWTEINTPENKATQEMCSHNINNTWAAQDTGDGYWTAITSDGVKECWIHFTYDWSYKNAEGETVKGEAAPQDEWLITPEFTVQQGHDLFFLCEVDRVANHGGQIQMRVRQSATDGIRAVETEVNDGPVQYFNLQGVAVPGADLVPGVYIRRQGTRVSKVTVR